MVTIGPDRLFDCTDVIGKVFEDRNRNGKQGDDEKGIANARVATVNGLVVTTDAQGRFHIACAALPNALIGSNFVLKLDLASLPSGMEVLSENPSSARLTAGLMNRINFAVAARSNYEAAFSPTDFTVDGTLRQERFEALVRQANEAAQARRILRLRYAAGASEDIRIARQWLDKVIMDLRRAVPALDALDSDIVRPTKRGVER